MGVAREIKRLMSSSDDWEHELPNLPEEVEKLALRPVVARSYSRALTAMQSTYANIYELPNSYAFPLNMPRLELHEVRGIYI